LKEKASLCEELALGIEVTGRRGRRRRKLLDDLRERRRYSHLKEKASLCGELTLGIEVTGRRGRRRRKLLNDLKERRG